jgi:hypothetical protein
VGLLRRIGGAAAAAGRAAPYRATAERMRAEEPELYAQIVAEARPVHVAPYIDPHELAQTDPDGYVALYLAGAADAGYPPWIPPDERAFRVEFRIGAWRASAEHLRNHDREFYALLLSQADGTDEEKAAGDDPDGYVALALSKQADRYAQQLRAEVPKRYAAILETAKGWGAEKAARLDPDAYVGMYLAEEEEGNLPAELRVQD